jgi:nonribosomal peptide synthetase DhbF
MRHFGSKYPIYGVQSRGLDGSERLAYSIDEMADDYLSEIRKVQPTGPYHLLGYSFGGITAHAIAAKLRAQGQEVALLAIIDAYPAHVYELGPAPTATEVLGFFVEGDATAPPPEEDFDTYLHKIVQHLRCRDSVFSIFDERTFANMVKVLLNNLSLFRSFASPVFDGHLLLFRATDPRTISVDSWGPHIRGHIEVHDLACHHKDLIGDQPLATIAAAISTRLSQLHPDYAASETNGRATASR